MSEHVFWTETPVSSPDLLHLLTCPTCRSWMIGRLLEQGTKDEETLVEEYGEMWARLNEKLPEHIEEGRARRETAERLLEDLLRTSPGFRLGMLRKERFRSLDLLDLLLENSHTCQLEDPKAAAELARLAARLAAVLGEDEQEAADLLPRALCLGANARRLLRNFKGADALLGNAAAFLTCVSERAFYCRTAGLVRWEQGRTDEAAALLHHAARLYAPGGPPGEEGACHALLGLLHHEQGSLGNALPLLLRAWTTMDQSARPLLTVRVALALAAGLADADQLERARAMLKEAWRLSSEVQDAQEMIRVYWLEGRALARLGEMSEAIQILDSVRRKLLQELNPAEAALVSLDLALALAESGKPEEIEPLIPPLEAAMRPSPALLLAVEGLDELAEAALRHDPNLRGMVIELSVTLRRMFRACEMWIRPLSFA